MTRRRPLSPLERSLLQSVLDGGRLEGRRVPPSPHKYTITKAGDLSVGATKSASLTAVCTLVERGWLRFHPATPGNYDLLLGTVPPALMASVRQMVDSPSV